MQEEGNIENLALEKSETMIKISFVDEKRISILDLTGDVIDIINEYLQTNEKLFPLFTLSNSVLLINYCAYK